MTLAGAQPSERVRPFKAGLAFHLAGLLAVVFLGVAALSVYADRQAELQGAENRASVQARSVAAFHADWLTQHFAALRAENATTAEQRRAQFVTWVRLDTQGQPTAEGDAALAAQLTPTDRAQLSKALHVGMHAWQGTDVAASGSYRLAVALPSGGMVLGLPRMDGLQRTLQAVQAQGSTQLALLDNAGRVVAQATHHDAPMPTLSEPLRLGVSGAFTFDHQGRAYLGHAQAQAVVGGSTWVVQRRDDALLPFRERAAMRLLTLAIFAAVLALVGSRVVATLAQQRRLLAAQHESDQRWRSVQAMSIDWYWQQDASLRFVRVGAHAVGPTQVAEQTHVGQFRWDVPIINMSPADWARHQADLHAHRPFRNLELQRPSQLGREVWMEISGDPIFDEQGAFTGYRGVGRDISARKAAEAQREALAEELRQAQKMEALGTLAGGIAHDFNNILGALLGNLVLLREKLSSQPTAAGHLALMESACERARRLVQQILVFSRHQQQVAKAQCLAPVVEEVAALLRATHPATIDIQVQPLQVGLPVLADSTQIHQVLMNLGTNACHAMPGAAGKLCLSLTQSDLSVKDLQGLPALQPGPHVCLAVQDDGVGMDADTVRRVFEPFFTTKAPGHGTGLGLAVVHGIVNKHLGAIRITSQPGQGTRFEVFLPRALALDAAVETVAEHPAPPTVQGAGQHILCVDDDETMRLTMQAQLEHWGFRVTPVSSAAEALAFLRDAPAAQVSLVLSDQSMPDMTGEALWHVVKAEWPGLAMVIISGYLSDALFQEAREHPRLKLVMKELAHQTMLPALLALMEPKLRHATEPARPGTQASSVLA